MAGGKEDRKRVLSLGGTGQEENETEGPGKGLSPSPDLSLCVRQVLYLCHQASLALGHKFSLCSAQIPIQV